MNCGAGREFISLLEFETVGSYYLRGEIFNNQYSMLNAQRNPH